MLKFTFDISTRTATPTHLQSIRRGDDEEIEVTLTKDGDNYELQTGERLIFTLKDKSAKRSADPLIVVATEDWTHATNVYKAALETDTAELLAAMDALEEGVTTLALVGDLSWYKDSAAGTKPKSSQDITVNCQNDVERDADGIPSLAATFWQRLKAAFDGSLTKDDTTQVITVTGGTGGTGDVGGSIHGATAKTTLANADEFGLWDSVSSALRKITWTNLKAAIKAYADTLYAALGHTHTQSDVTGLVSALAGKAAASHTHATSDVTGLDTALAGKAASSHTHSDATTSAAGFMSASDKTKLNGIESGATADMTAAEILTAIKTVDGSGSGLDADLLDGESKAYFGTASETNNLLASVIACADRLVALESVDYEARIAALEAKIADLTSLTISGGNLVVTDNSANVGYIGMANGPVV
jgi:hypothetical protein